MATATAKRRTKKGSTTKPKGKAAATKSDGPGKRELAKARDAEQTKRMLAAREDGNSWSEIASELNITPGKAQFLMMLHRVATGDVAAIKFRNDDELQARVKAARTKADEFSSWGWIAARTGVSEVKIKRLAEEDGFWTPKSENIAVTRAERNGGTKASTAKGGGTRKTSTASGSKASKAAKAKARAKKKGSNPS